VLPHVDTLVLSSLKQPLTRWARSKLDVGVHERVSVPWGVEDRTISMT
jgi:hypothetical protein